MYAALKTVNKVFKRSNKKLEWVYDADEFGNFITGKHKGTVGLILEIW